MLVERWGDGVTQETGFASLESALRAAREFLVGSDAVWARVERRVDGIVDPAHSMRVTQ